MSKAWELEEDMERLEQEKQQIEQAGLQRMHDLKKKQHELAMRKDEFQINTQIVAAVAEEEAIKHMEVEEADTYHLCSYSHHPRTLLLSLYHCRSPLPQQHKNQRQR